VVDFMVPRDGVEPPTPAFSGLHSTKVICLIQQNLASPSSFGKLDASGARETETVGLGCLMRGKAELVAFSERPEAPAEVACGFRDEIELPETFINYDDKPREYTLRI